MNLTFYEEVALDQRSFLIGFASGVFITVVTRKLAPSRTVIRTVHDLPSSWIKEKRWLKGRVAKIVDGDSIRVFHGNSRGRNGLLSETSLMIRLYGVEAPEKGMGKGLADDSRKTLDEILPADSRVRLQLLAKDQYGRAVCRVLGPRRRFWSRHGPDASVELLKRGMVTMYRRQGAEYGGIEEKLNAIEAKASKAKLGIWKSLGKDAEQKIAQFKKQK